MPTTVIDRWNTMRWVIILLVAFLAGEGLYFTSIREDAPPRIDEIIEDVSIEFTVNTSAVLVLDACVNGRWSVEGADAVRVNHGDWVEHPTGRYTLCNQPNLSPTLEVRLPSSSIESYQLNVTVVYGNGLHVLAGLALLFIAMWIFGMQTASHQMLIALVMGVHIGLVIIYHLTIDLSITSAWTWDTWVYTVPMTDLRANVFESIIYQHAQPPLFSLYGILLDTLLGDNYTTAMLVGQVAMGALMCGISYRLFWHLTQNQTLTLFASLVLALNPALFFFEAIILHTIHTAFWMMLAVYCLYLYQQYGQNRYLYLFVLSINLVMLTHSLYHILFLIPVLILVAILVQQESRRVMIGCVCICLLSVGLYGKNLIMFGNFSSSSLLGMNLWEVARYDYETDELTKLLQAGILTDSTVINASSLMPPSAYPKYDQATGDIAILSGDNINNAVYPEINALYLDNALRLIWHDVGRYFNGVLRAYGHYTCPSSTYAPMTDNLNVFPASHQAVSVELLHMRGLTQEIARRLGLTQEEYGACSNLYAILPIVMLGYPLWLVFRFRANLNCWVEGIRRDSILIFIWWIVTFTTVSTSLLITPENAHFKFMVEMPFLVFLIVMIWRIAPSLMPDELDNSDD